MSRKRKRVYQESKHKSHHRHHEEQTLVLPHVFTHSLSSRSVGILSCQSRNIEKNRERVSSLSHQFHVIHQSPSVIGCCQFVPSSATKTIRSSGNEFSRVCVCVWSFLSLCVLCYLSYTTHTYKTSL